MKNKLLRNVLLLCTVFILISGSTLNARADIAQASMSIDCKSAILMEAETGKVLYSQNQDQALPPASVTKIMTLLIVMEAIEEGRISYDDIVVASANACSMGGSQIYLEQGFFRAHL